MSVNTPEIENEKKKQFLKDYIESKTKIQIFNSIFKREREKKQTNKQIEKRQEEKFQFYI